MSTQKLSVSVENLAPQNGTSLTPTWVGFHNGGFDTYNRGEAVTEGLERLAEDGTTGVISQEFAASGAGNVDGVVGGAPIAPGDIARTTLAVDPTTGRFFNYAAMVLPSNDTFIANGNPEAFQVFDENGNFIGTEFTVTQALDAGTEVNDELPANTAFFGQATPDTGVDEDGVVTLAEGFNPVGSGGILDDPRFANGDYTAPGYQFARIRVANLVEGTDAGERLFGTSAQDDIFAGEGDNTIFGNGGNDRIYAGAGNDRIFGESGNDVIDAGDGDNKIFGNGGNDQITTGAGDDTIFAGSGNDVINAGDGKNTIYGNGGNDFITAGAGSDRVYGAAGNEVINAGDGDNLLFGNGGNDSFTTGAGNDSIFAGSGNDIISTGAGNDLIYGNGGDDVFDAGTGSDRVFAEAGSDTFVLNAGQGQVDIYNYGINDVFSLGASLTGSSVDVSASNGNTVLSSGNDVLATLLGVQVSQITIA